MTTSPLKVEDSRADFEAWVMRINPNADLSIMMDGIDKGEYVDGYHAGLFAAWQASRAAIVVDIDWPEDNDDTWKEGVEGAYAMGHEDGKDKVVIAVRQAIRAAGITVKGD